MTSNLTKNPGDLSLVKPTHQSARVLFAMYAASAPKEALRRAYALAKTLGGELLVVSVLPEIKRNNMLFPQNHLIDAVRTIGMGKRALRHTRTLCDQALPDHLDDDDILVQQGNFLATVVSVAREFEASMIVLPPAEGRNGSQVTKLARLTQTPVLVARRPGNTETIIAASDLQDQQYPILKRANGLSQRFDAPVVFVHNVPHTPSQGEMALPIVDELQARRRQLKRAAESLSLHADNVVLSAVSTVEAILSIARQKHADLIVVGAYRRNWVEKLISAGVAAQVIERASRSVLVTPLQ